MTIATITTTDGQQYRVESEENGIDTACNIASWVRAGSPFAATPLVKGGSRRLDERLIVLPWENVRSIEVPV